MTSLAILRFHLMDSTMRHHELIELHECHVCFGAVALQASESDIEWLITSAATAWSQVIKGARSIRQLNSTKEAEVWTTFDPVYFV